MSQNEPIVYAIAPMHPGLKPKQVCGIWYITRDLTGHDDHEEDTIEAFWTGDVDIWGKLTIQPIDGSPTLYLFPDEIQEVSE